MTHGNLASICTADDGLRDIVDKYKIQIELVNEYIISLVEFQYNSYVRF